MVQPNVCEGNGRKRSLCTVGGSSPGILVLWLWAVERPSGSSVPCGRGWDPAGNLGLFFCLVVWQHKTTCGGRTGLCQATENDACWFIYQVCGPAVPPTGAYLSLSSFQHLLPLTERVSTVFWLFFFWQQSWSCAVHPSAALWDALSMWLKSLACHRWVCTAFYTSHSCRLSRFCQSPGCNRHSCSMVLIRLHSSFISKLSCLPLYKKWARMLLCLPCLFISHNQQCSQECLLSLGADPHPHIWALVFPGFSVKGLFWDFHLVPMGLKTKIRKFLESWNSVSLTIYP